jgi:hypothetical protein
LERKQENLGATIRTRNNWNRGEEKEWSVRNMDEDDNVWGADKGKDREKIEK